MLQTAIASACAVALLIAGPLPQCYVVPNNFTSHGIYQHHYRAINWQWSFFSEIPPQQLAAVAVMLVDEVSPFYQTLSHEPGDRPIVEYPMMIGDHYDPFYYYQHFHRRWVMAGYTTDVAAGIGLAAGNVFGNTYIDQVLTLVPDKSRLHFRNFVDMDDLPKMRERNVEYVILHKRFESQLPLIMLPLPDLDRLLTKYRTALGAPYYEDDHIAVFRP